MSTMRFMRRPMLTPLVVATLAVAALAHGALSGCNGAVPAPTAPPAQGEALAHAAAPGPSARLNEPLPSGARLVTDISGSMRGFIAPKSVALTRIHEELVGAIGDAEDRTLDLCLVASDVECPPRNDLARYSRSELYQGLSSRFDQVLDLDAEDGPNARRFTLVVTDGVYGGQDSSDASQAGCSAGSTASCITKRLERLVDEGYGVWALGIALPFAGRVYAERAMDASMFERLAQGLPDGQKVSKFKASAADAGYYYEGPRPLLVLVVSRDIAGARQLTTNMQQRLLALGLADPAGRGVVRSEWAPLEPRAAQISTVHADAKVRTDGFLLGQGGRLESGFAQIVRCAREDKAMLNVGLDNPDASLELTPLDTPPLGVLFDLATTADGFHFGLVCAPIAQGTSVVLGFALSPSDPAGRLRASWWHDWSAPDTWSRPDGLFGLESIASGVATHAARALPPDDHLHIRVERQ